MLFSLLLLLTVYFKMATSTRRAVLLLMAAWSVVTWSYIFPFVLLGFIPGGQWSSKYRIDQLYAWIPQYIIRHARHRHRIEFNQKSDSRENLSPFLQYACPKYAINTPSIRHFDAILTPSWLVPPALLTFKATFACYEGWRFANVLYL